jgi:membrane-associated phospholipid phosphatase
VNHDSASAPLTSTRVPGLRWWKEVLYCVGFYVVYSVIRNLFGSAAVEPEEAFANAERIIEVQRALGLYFEETVQGWFLGWEWFLKGWNIFYGSFHFVVTAGALIWMYHRQPRRYPLWRTTLAGATALALIGFATIPLMPPRLMPTVDPSYEYVDTLAEIGGLWSFDEGPVAEVSNQYAAMPSLHFGWSLWSALVLWPMVRRWWLKALVALYPVATVFAIIVTANHFWLDAVGGAVVVGGGYLIARGWYAWRDHPGLEGSRTAVTVPAPGVAAPHETREDQKIE